jgi:hypothetical protein
MKLKKWIIGKNYLIQLHYNMNLHELADKYKTDKGTDFFDKIPNAASLKHRHTFTRGDII